LNIFLKPGLNHLWAVESCQLLFCKLKLGIREQSTIKGLRF